MFVDMHIDHLQCASMAKNLKRAYCSAEYSFGRWKQMIIYNWLDEVTE